jgi:hypothetical protein
MPVAMDHAVLRRDDLAGLNRVLVLGLHPLAVVGVDHKPPELSVLAILRGVAREVLDPGAHVHRRVRAAYLLQINDRRDLLDQRAVPVLGLP